MYPRIVSIEQENYHQILKLKDLIESNLVKISNNTNKMIANAMSIHTESPGELNHDYPIGDKKEYASNEECS